MRIRKRLWGHISKVFIFVLLLSFIPIDSSWALVKVPTENTRISGGTRYDTAIEIANNLYRKNGAFDNVIVASGETYADALSSGFLAKKMNAPILLVDALKVDYVAEYIRSHIKDDGTVFIVGGPNSVTENFDRTLEEIGLNYERIDGPNRYDTNLELLNRSENAESEIIICSGKGYADSLTASATGKPIMLVGDTLRLDQANYLRNLKPSKIYVIGGTLSVSNNVFSSLKSIANTERIGGSTRYETAVLVARKFFPGKVDTIVITTAVNYPDGLAGAAYAMDIGAPIITISDNGDFSKAKEYVKEKDIRKSVTLGGTVSLSQKAVNRLMDRYTNYNDAENTIGNKGTAQDVLNVMRGWLGYSEANGKHREIVDIYNSLTPLPWPDYEVGYDEAWCDVCVSAAAVVAGCSDLIGIQATVPYHIDIFKNKGIWIEDGTITPKPGYVIVYCWSVGWQPNNGPADHIGFVESVSLSTGMITAIEGNRQGAVMRRTFPIGWGYIRGYAAPNYPVR